VVDHEYPLQGRNIHFKGGISKGGITTSREEYPLQGRTSVQNRRLTSSHLKREWRDNSGVVSSGRTVRRRLIWSDESKFIYLEVVLTIQVSISIPL